MRVGGILPFLCNKPVVSSRRCQLGELLVRACVCVQVRDQLKAIFHIFSYFSLMYNINVLTLLMSLFGFFPAPENKHFVLCVST